MKAAGITAALLLLLAGCTSSPAPETPEAGAPESMQQSTVDVPTWAIGDYWQYTFGGQPTTFVVASDAGSDWVIKTDNPDLTFWNNDIELISYLGEQRKMDLAGIDDDGYVDFFNWPLEDGKSWTTVWDGNSVDITATEVDDGRYRMDVINDGIPFAEYEYNAEVGWFEWMQFRGDGGQALFRMDLESSGSNYTGEWVEVTTTIIDSYDGTGARTDTYGELNAPEGSDLYLWYEADCQVQGFFFFAVGPVENAAAAGAEQLEQNDDGFTDAENCPHSTSFNGVIGLQPNEGNWGMAAEVPPGASYSFTLYQRDFARNTL